MQRYEGLKKYNNFEEYAAACERMKVYLKQYKWITETDSPYEDIRSSLEKCIILRKKYEEHNQGEFSNLDSKNFQEEKSDLHDNILSKEDMIKNEGEILTLKMQYEAIKSDTYVSKLKRNITALYLQIGEYEARMESGIFKRKNDKELRKNDPLYTAPSMRRFRFFMANVTGMVPGEVNTNIEDRKEIPTYIMENYDLVNFSELKSHETKEIALTVVPEIDASEKMYNRLFRVPVSNFIASYGIKEKSENTKVLEQENTSNINVEKTINYDTKVHDNNYLKEKKDKSNEEIEH